MARLILALAVGIWLAALSPAVGAEFRIENRVFVAEEPEPVSESTTLFMNGRVYDFFGGENGEIAIYDPNHERFLLLDPARRIKTEIKTSYVDNYVAAIRKKAIEHDNEFVKFLANPQFKREFDQNASRLTLSSESMTYRVDTVAAENEEAARVYADFSDAYARLGAITSDVPLPPYPRLAVNAALRERKEFPKRVERTVARTGLGPLPDKSVTIYSEHKIAWRLVESDRRRIDVAAKYLGSFKDVPLQVYRSAPLAEKIEQ
jgi:hypothetical protein